VSRPRSAVHGRTTSITEATDESGGRRPVTPVEQFVEIMAAELDLGTTPSDRRTRRQLLRLSQWASAQGMALDREIILDPDTVERFVLTALGGERSRATSRAALRKVGSLLTKRAPWEPRPTAIPRRQLAPPYSTEEIRIISSDAARQPTPSRQRAAWALVLLGLGAGLDGRWATRVSGRDVTQSAWGVTVKVGEPCPRSVVVLGGLEDPLSAMAAAAGDDFLVGGRSTSNRRTGQLTERLVTPTGHPRLAPARLRSTWLLWHLEAGTRLPELCRAAGLRGPGVLGDLFEFAEAMDEDIAVEMLRAAVV
jgi:hypothetical protein